jgi:flagellin-like protein
MNKRGISNLIGVALLIVFIISLGIIVTNWSKKLTKEGIEISTIKIGTDLECQGVSLKIEQMKGPGGVVDSDKVIVKNNVPIKGFITRFITENKAIVDYANEGTELKKFDAFVFDLKGTKKSSKELDLEDLIKGVSKIEIIPRIDIGDGVTVDCENKRGNFGFESPLNL